MSFREISLSLRKGHPIYFPFIGLAEIQLYFLHIGQDQKNIGANDLRQLFPSQVFVYHRVDPPVMPVLVQHHRYPSTSRGDDDDSRIDHLSYHFVLDVTYRIWGGNHSSPTLFSRGFNLLQDVLWVLLLEQHGLSFGEEISHRFRGILPDELGVVPADAHSVHHPHNGNVYPELPKVVVQRLL